MMTKDEVLVSDPLILTLGPPCEHDRTPIAITMTLQTAVDL